MRGHEEDEEPTSSSMTEVPRVSAASITPEEFRRRFLEPNLPVLLVDGTSTWRAMREWVNADGSPDVEELSRLFGGSQVSVTCAEACERTDMTLEEYARWWRERAHDDKQRVGWRYLKDWHLPQLYPEYGAYQTPPHLADDWLNEHWAASRRAVDSATQDGSGDHRFVYLGPAGSRTSLHADVLFSFSWSVNVAGTKRWLLVPAEDRRLVADAATAPLGPDLADIAAFAGQAQRDSADASAPTAPRAVPRVLEVEQGPGDILFVPSAWYHQVENVTDALSINHNWLNGTNARWALVRLLETLAAVRLSLGPDADDEELCHQLVGRRCGMDLYEFADLLAGVALRRLHTLGAAHQRITRAAARTQAAADARRGQRACAAHTSHRRAQAVADAHQATSLLRELLDRLASAGFDDDLGDPRRQKAVRQHRRVLEVVERGLEREEHLVLD